MKDKERFLDDLFGKVVQKTPPKKTAQFKPPQTQPQIANHEIDLSKIKVEGILNPSLLYKPLDQPNLDTSQGKVK